LKGEVFGKEMETRMKPRYEDSGLIRKEKELKAADGRLPQKKPKGQL